MVSLPRALAWTVGVIALSLVAVWLVRSRTGPDGKAPASPPPTATRTVDGGVQVTDGVKHSVPLAEIVGGGVPRDGIPPIDAPTFTALPAVDPVLRDDGLGIALVVGEDARFYPYQILVWHEIVNDTVGQRPVSITYCPLCFTGIVFDRRIAGRETTFGTSGKLWKSNLVMYDRATESYWSQVTGEAIVGVRTGTKLDIVPADTMPLRVFRERYPRGKVLTTDTGHARDYTEDPYGDYYTSRRAGFGVVIRDDRFHPKAVMMGVVLDGKAVAVPTELVLQQRELTGTVGSSMVIARADAQARSVRVFRQAADRTETLLPAFPVFWFSWVAAHPDTMVLGSP